MAEILDNPSTGKVYLRDGAGTREVNEVIDKSGVSTFLDAENKSYDSDGEAIKEFSPSFYDYAQQIIGQGTLMGFGDEIAGAAKGAYGALGTDQPFSEGMSQGIDAERAQMQKVEESLGMPATLALQAGGGLLTGGLGAGRAIAGKGLSMGAKALRGAMQGGVQGGITGAGMSEGNVLDIEGLKNRAGGAGAGAGLGVLGGAALPALSHGLTEGAKSVGRLFPGGVQRQAAGLLRGTVPKADIPRLEQQVMANPHSVIADFAPVDAKRVVGEATRTVGSGPQVKYLKARHRTQASRIIPTVDEFVSNKSIGETIQDLTSQRQASAQKNYGKFYENPVEVTDKLKGFFEKDAFQDAYKFAQKLANNDGVPLPPLYEVGADGSKRYLKANAQLLDYIKQGMDATVDSAYRESGTLGNSLKTLRNNYRDHLDEMLPDYKQARSEYAGHSAAMEAAENGRKFMMSLGDEGKSLKGIGRADIADLGEHELEAFRSGAASALRDKIERKGFGANVTTLFDSPGVVKDLNAVMGRDAAREFRKVIETEAKMAETWAENQGSQTAQRASAGQTMGTVLPEMAATGGIPILSLAREAVNKIAPQPEAVAKTVSRLMASPKLADKQMAFKIMRGGVMQQPLSKLRGMAQGATSGVGGYLGGKYGANN